MACLRERVGVVLVVCNECMPWEFSSLRWSWRHGGKVDANDMNIHVLCRCGSWHTHNKHLSLFFWRDKRFQWFETEILGAIFTESKSREASVFAWLLNQDSNVFIIVQQHVSSWTEWIMVTSRCVISTGGLGRDALRLQLTSPAFHFWDNCPEDGPMNHLLQVFHCTLIHAYTSSHSWGHHLQ